jgi:hypothetical protein
MVETIQQEKDENKNYLIKVNKSDLTNIGNRKNSKI